ncbi:unnamed protein product, partial [Protopolystoma xenopodis]
MPRFGQLVIGPAGCGKSTYCSIIQKHCEAIKRQVSVLNLDPAAEYFDYEPIADVKNLIQDESLKLGPNGGLIFCMEFLYQNLDWLDEAIGDDDGDYILFDCPGQIELYSHLNIMPRIVEHLMNKWDFRFVTVFILDARFLVDSSHFLAGVLAALSSMSAFSTPHVNVMSKLDLLSEKKEKHVIARYMEPDMTEFFGDSSDDCDNDTNTASMGSKFFRLSKALADIVSRYSLVQFMPLNREKEETIEAIMLQIDTCLQYDEEVDPRNRLYDEAEQEMYGFGDDSR